MDNWGQDKASVRGPKPVMLFLGNITFNLSLAVPFRGVLLGGVVPTAFIWISPPSHCPIFNFIIPLQTKCRKPPSWLLVRIVSNAL